MKYFFAFVLSGLTLLCANAQNSHPPKTKTTDSSDTYFGVVYKDPYRWLEYTKLKETEDWFRQQSAYSDEILNKISGRDDLVSEWKSLDKLQPPQIRGRDYYAGRFFYRKTMPGEPVAKYYYRQGFSGKEILLFDPQTYVKGKTLSIQSTIPSFDGKKVLISYSESGAEVSTIKVLDVDSGTFLPDTIFPSWFGPIGWTFDNRAFTYFSQKTADQTDPSFIQNTKTRLHKLGDDVKNDTDFFSNESYPSLNIQANELPFAGTNKDSKKYVFADVANVRSEMVSFFADIKDINGILNWKVLSTQKDAIVKGREIIGDDVYAITYKGARNYKLVHTSLRGPDWEKADVIMEEKNNLTLEAITHCRDFLIASYSDGINNHIYKYNFKTKEISEVKTPYQGSIFVFCLDNSTNRCIFNITSWNKPFTEFDVDLNTETFTPSSFNKPAVYPKKYQDLEVKEVEVRGHDNVLVPLSIIYQKGTKLDGSNVCLMDSYGAYGSSMIPYFNNFYATLAIKGVVIAIPHVRGGSEKGQEWYKAGYKTTKPNTWKDFISCAEYLIEQGYTRASKIAGTGTSAGGILISRAITERPDLFAAAICNVGCANSMRMEFSPNGPGNIPEFGTVKDSIECRALYEMDGVQHVSQNVKYPAVICVGGWNDPRVPVWQPGKFAAALQNSSTSQKPVLLKINFDDGHFTEDKNVTYSNFANQFAFVLWQCGHPLFKVKN